MVAAQHQRYQLALGFGGHQQRLDGARRGDGEELRQFLDGFDAGGSDFLALCTRGRAFVRGCDGFGHFDIGGVTAGVAEGDIILAGVRQHMKLVGRAAADTAGVGNHRPELQRQPGEDIAVGLVHDLVGLLQRCLAGMKRVGIFHQELAGSHDAEARADFIAHLGLDLVEVDGQLLVALDFVAHQVGDDLLMGWPQAKIPLVPVPDTQQLGAVLLPAAGFLPQLRRLHHRHTQFLGAGFVHFFPHYGLHLAQHPQSQWQPGVEAGGQLADQAGAQHQLVTDHLGVGRGFFLGGDKEVTGAHCGVRVVGPKQGG